jgi:transposase
MPQKSISANKVCQLLHLSASENFNKSQSAKRLKIARSTATKYIKAFQRSTLTLTDIERVGSAALANLLFAGHRPRSQSDRKANFLDRIEAIHYRIEHDHLSILDAWREEAEKQHSGYKYSRFASLYANWRVEQGLPKTIQCRRNAVSIKPADIPTLNKWRLSHDRRKWEVAIALLNNSMGVSSIAIGRKIDRAPRTVEKWCLLYEHEGIKSLPLRRSRTLSEESLATIKAKKERLIKIIHETPKIYDINRASWSLHALRDAYQKTYGECISKSSISEYFVSEGYKFKKAKKVLTSEDPTYRDKLAKITNALSHLSSIEKFFSIDEFGPFSVKICGGVALVLGMKCAPYLSDKRAKAHSYAQRLLSS